MQLKPNTAVMLCLWNQRHNNTVITACHLNVFYSLSIQSVNPLTLTLFCDLSIETCGQRSRQKIQWSALHVQVFCGSCWAIKYRLHQLQPAAMQKFSNNCPLAPQQNWVVVPLPPCWNQEKCFAEVWRNDTMMIRWYANKVRIGLSLACQTAVDSGLQTAARKVRSAEAAACAGPNTVRQRIW